MHVFGLKYAQVVLAALQFLGREQIPTGDLTHRSRQRTGLWPMRPAAQTHAHLGPAQARDVACYVFLDPSLFATEGRNFSLGWSKPVLLATDLCRHTHGRYETRGSHGGDAEEEHGSHSREPNEPGTVDGGKKAKLGGI